MAAHSRHRDTSDRFLLFKRYILTWAMLGVALFIIGGHALSVTFQALKQAVSGIQQTISSIFASPIAPLFTSEIDYWNADLTRWADEYDVDPNLLATIMQIESCGHPTISSYAGAQGLFQVMPFHFSVGENQIDPDTNAMRGASFIRQCIDDWTSGDVGLALACYNGGPSIIKKPFHSLSDQTQRYYKWGTGIYADALVNHASSSTLDQWLNAGGSGLCSMVASEQAAISH